MLLAPPSLGYAEHQQRKFIHFISHRKLLDGNAAHIPCAHTRKGFSVTNKCVHLHAHTQTQTQPLPTDSSVRRFIRKACTKVLFNVSKQPAESRQQSSDTHTHKCKVWMHRSRSHITHHHKINFPGIAQGVVFSFHDFERIWRGHRVLAGTFSARF